MVEDLPPVAKESVPPLVLLVVGLFLLTEPIFGFSRLFPDGVFNLIFGFVLLACGVFLYWSGR